VADTTQNGKRQTNDGGSRARWPASAWLLAALSIVGLVGFVATFAFVLSQTSVIPRAAAPAAPKPAAIVPGSVMGERGPQGERGPPGPPGRAGDPGVRILRHDCAGGNCTVQCNDDEVLLTAHCGVGRTPAVYPTQHSALCRTRGTAKVEIVAACVRSSP
jgi:hypothetical protein